jgi:3-hydroxybutyryl-CoA dehydrogenase
MNLTSIGIIGAGQMGSGIAYVCAASGYKVKLYDIDSKLINIALEKINKNLSYQLK